MHNNEAENSIEQVLDSCLEEIICSGCKIEECLAKYPEHASELEPLLKIASASHKAVNISPNESFKAKARYEFNAAVADMAQNRTKRWFTFAPVWAQAAVGVLFAIMISGGALVAASGNSLPGQALYGVKLAAEQVRMGFTFSESAKSELSADLANRRVAEIVTLAEMEKPEEIRVAANHLDTDLETIAELNVKSVTAGAVPPPDSQQPGDIVSYVENTDELRTQIPDMFILDSGDSELVYKLKQKGLAGYKELVSSLEKASDSIKPALEEALILYLQGYETAIKTAGQ